MLRFANYTDNEREIRDSNQPETVHKRSLLIHFILCCLGTNSLILRPLQTGT